ncbi:hypothetical protein GCM10022237_25170 [Nocardioides ginsengisoli]|uniref:SMP-30/gluconolactonase/LRE family protein n=1 Tax=Nocardioides ginsengisoli TaxID=363868 RepID=A0ABW3W7Q8_9ACTN
MPTRHRIGEHPLWDDATQRLVWVDCLAGKVWAARPGIEDPTKLYQTRDAGPIGCAALRANGGLVVAGSEGVVLVEPSGETRQLADIPLRPGVRFNDGACDPAGRFLVGTTGGDVPGLGELYSVEPDGRYRRLLSKLDEANGIGWSLQGDQLYFIDSGEPHIWVFDYDVATGELSKQRVFARNPGLPGVLDGLAVDRAGHVWVAMWGGSAVLRYDPAGAPCEVIPTPVSQPTCPAFGGPGLDTLYLTTGAFDMTAHESAAQPWAGHVLRHALPVEGRRPHLFGA